MSNNSNKINRSIQFKNGSYSSVLIIIVIAIVIIINLAVNALPTEFTTFNTSSLDYYSISDVSKDMLKNLDKNINIYMLSDSSGSYNEYIETVCGIYEDNSDKIVFKKVDIAVEPGFTAKYAATNASQYSVIVEESATGKYKVLDYTDMVYTKSQYDAAGNTTYTNYYDAEGQISSAINYIVSEKTVMIYEMTGHGELSLADYEMKDAFDKSNYTLAEEALNLSTTDSIPEDCNVLFIFSPTADYSQAEVTKIKEYISNGGNVIIIYNNVYNIDMPNFYNLMEYIGISVTEGLVIEQDDSYYYSASQDPQKTIMPDKNPYSPILEGLENSYIISFYASPVKQIETVACTSTYTELLKTSSNYQVVFFDDEYTVDYTESASIATYVESVFSETNATAKTLVIGNSLFLANVTNDDSISFNNIKFVNNAIKEMVGDTDSIYIEPKTFNETYNVTSQSQVNIYSILYLGLIPLAFLLAGISVTILRRAK